MAMHGLVKYSVLKLLGQWRSKSTMLLSIKFLNVIMALLQVLLDSSSGRFRLSIILVMLLVLL